jgi:hypothetical protein
MGCFDNQEKVWKTVCKVGTGFDDSEINDLQQSLKVMKISQDYSKVPKWLNVSKSLSTYFLVLINLIFLAFFPLLASSSSSSPLLVSLLTLLISIPSLGSSRFCGCRSLEGSSLGDYGSRVLGI